MGKFARRVFVNQIKQIDKAQKPNCKSKARLRTADVHAAMQQVRAASRVTPGELQEIKDIGRGHALWIHMLTLKKDFNFTGKMLVDFRGRYNDVFNRAVDSEEDGAAKCIEYTVKRSPDEDAGNIGYADFEQFDFDPGNTVMNDVERRYGRRSPVIYKKLERCFSEFNKAEVVSMLVLFDYYGFRIKRLKRFINTIRKKYGDGAGPSLNAISYLEKLCKTGFPEFDRIRNGQGISEPA